MMETQLCKIQKMQLHVYIYIYSPICIYIHQYTKDGKAAILTPHIIDHAAWYVETALWSWHLSGWISRHQVMCKARNRSIGAVERTNDRRACSAGSCGSVSDGVAEILCGWDHNQILSHSSINLRCNVYNAFQLPLALQHVCIHKMHQIPKMETIPNWTWVGPTIVETLNLYIYISIYFGHWGW